MNQINKKGYTLIEILVVIAIIGFIASVATYSLNSARVKSRDAKRMADLEVIGKAIELYYDDYGHYPLGYPDIGYGIANSHNSVQWSVLQTELIEYITLPVDPLNKANPGGAAYTPGDNFIYTYYRSGPEPQEYDLITQLEDKNNELRCETRCWQLHSGAFGDIPWCGATSPNCSGFYNTDNDIYADH